MCVLPDCTVFGGSFVRAAFIAGGTVSFGSAFSGVAGKNIAFVCRS
jgi:hypothetical protein